MHNCPYIYVNDSKKGNICGTRIRKANMSYCWKHLKINNNDTEKKDEQPDKQHKNFYTNSIQVIELTNTP